MAVDTRRFKSHSHSHAALSWSRRMAFWFYVMLALVLVEFSCLLYVGFVNDLDALSPLEAFLITSLAIDIDINNSEEDNPDDPDDDVMQLEDRMAQRLEHEMNQQEQQQLKQHYEQQQQQQQQQHDQQQQQDQPRPPEDEDEDQQQLVQELMESPLLQGNPIDDYFSRRHIQDTLVPLVVGGSDGSGTRAFVDVLGRLGVPMLVDDAGTMDIHAAKLFQGKGWPPFAKIALQYSPTTSNYQVTDLPPDKQSEVQAELRVLKDQFDRRSTKLRLKVAAKPNITLSSTVLYGFKAPITMMLLPMLHSYMYPTGFKYLHIVRDGRDVALSNNQSPVTKFYNYTYKDAQLRLHKYRNMAPVFGMQLWNDWNADLFDWEKNLEQQQQQQQLYSDQNQTFDYLVMRTEDLLNPESKFEALRLLADFVGSPKTLEELCCISRKAIVDMGQSNTLAGGKTVSRGQALLKDYFDRKKAFLQELATLAGKSSPEQLTARERLDAMAKYRTIKKQQVKNVLDGVQLSEERRRKFAEISNRVAKRIGHRASLGQENRNPWTTSVRDSITKNYKKKKGAKIDPAIADLVGRRRLLEDSLLERSHLASSSKLRRVDYQHRSELDERPDRIAILKAKLRAERFRGEGNVMERHGSLGGVDHGLRYKKKPKLDHGDEALGKLIVSQLDILKGAAAKKQNVTDRYGKWTSMLSSRPELSEAMHREGARALKAFGYLPPQRFMDRAKDSFVCDDTVVCSDS